MKKGFALITVLAVAIMIALGAATVLQSMTGLGTMKATNIKEVQYKYLTEAGLVHAYWRCQQAGGCVSENSFSIEGIPVPIIASGLTNGDTTEIFVRSLYADA